MKTLLIKNALRVARMDDSRSEIAGGDILVEGNAIRRVGRACGPGRTAWSTPPPAWPSPGS